MPRKREPLRLLIIYGIPLAMAVAAALLLPPDVDDTPIHAADGERVIVRDGDTLAMAGSDFRLQAIDAPELHQTCEDENGQPWRCGETAKAAMRDLVARGGLVCTPTAKDKYSRKVAVCAVTGEPDIGEAMIRQGLAISTDRGLFSAYNRAQGAARDARLGLWRGDFQKPADWRKDHPRPMTRR